MKIKIDNNFLVLNPSIMEEKVADIEMLYVAPESRGKKNGYKLLDEARKWAKENGFERLSLCAYPQEDNGMTEYDLMKYYEGYGFDSFEGTEIMYMEV